MAKPLYFIFILFLACSKTASVPKDLLSAEQMAKALTQIHINQTLVTRMNFVKADSSQIAYAELERRAFSKLKIDTALYKKSYRFYAEHPAMMKDIYQIVEKEVVQLKKLDSLAKVKKNKIDSLATIKGPGKPSR